MAEKPKNPLTPDQQAVVKQAQDALSPMVREAVQAITRAGDQVRAIAESAGDAVRRVTEVVNARARELTVALEAVLQSKPVRKAFEDWQRIQKDLPPRVKAIMKTLGDNGWYPDEERWTLEEMAWFGDARDHGDAESAQRRLCEHFDHFAEEIVAGVIADFPKREAVLQMALDAHRAGHFCLSIPIWLMQADGICDEVLEVQLYSLSAGVPGTAKKVGPYILPDAFEGLTFNLLTVGLPISASREQRKGLKGVG